MAASNWCSMERCTISEIKIPFTFRQDMGDLQSLAESIRKLGLLQPITVTHENQLVFGLRRLKACELLGWESIPITVLEATNHGSRDGGSDPASDGG